MPKVRCKSKRYQVIDCASRQTCKKLGIPCEDPSVVKMIDKGKRTSLEFINNCTHSSASSLNQAEWGQGNPEN